MKKSLTFRVMSGVIVASTLLILPATATAAVQELTRSAQADGEPPENDAFAGQGTATAVSKSAADQGAGAKGIAGRAGAGKGVAGRDVVGGQGVAGRDVGGRDVAGRRVAGSGVAGKDAGGQGAAAGTPASADAGRLARAANLPFRVAVPGAVASGVYTTAKGSSQITVTLKVTGRAPCGVFQSTRNGPADGIEWHTVGALCSPGTATFRTSVNRLWGSRSLPSIRLCNGDSLGLAEGVDCDDFVPPRGA
ncbi:hypothetical protein Aph02nite_89910 [Actinoplanes philippinensis]|uniref:Uncharacterized protein n=2 Tax=Actinoplanes philippinensis TaxID=35752 RepID=A0A1I2M9S6_9ACTN|nr:hypothetical protein Aph02nite_89910 [Actinoplanes philippinensis]SFF86277.1 hypothetical protein SAMN05421541_12655 [Actinoplanes philippinensis]